MSEHQQAPLVLQSLIGKTEVPSCYAMMMAYCFCHTKPQTSQHLEEIDTSQSGSIETLGGTVQTLNPKPNPLDFDGGEHSSQEKHCLNVGEGREDKVSSLLPRSVAVSAGAREQRRHMSIGDRPPFWWLALSFVHKWTVRLSCVC